MGEITSIRLHRRTKVELDRFKVHPREPYEDVIKRLMGKMKKHEKAKTGL